MSAPAPIVEPPFSASDNRIGKAAAAVKQMALDYLARAREHQAAFMFTGASGLVSIGSMLSGMVMVRWISPEDVGLWKSVQMAVTYSMFVLAGVNNGLSRDLPYYFGKSDEKTASRLASTTLFCVLGAGLLVLLAGGGGLLLFRDHGTHAFLRVDATKNDLIRAPHFETNKWPKLSDAKYAERIYHAYHIEPYFNVNLSAAENGVLIPTNGAKTLIANERFRELEPLGDVVKASDVIGKEVKNFHEGKLGKVEDLAVDLGSGRIVYVILTTGSKNVAVIPQSFRYDPSTETVWLDGNKEKWESLPNLDLSKWDDCIQSNRVFGIYRYSDQRPYFLGASESKRILSPTTPLGYVARASKLIGTPVENKKDEKLGTVANLLISLKRGRIVHVVVASSGLFGIGHALSPIPPTIFSYDSSKLIFAIATVTVLIILTFYTNYLIVTFRSSKSFKDFSKIKMLEALVTVATIPLLYYLGYHGMLVRVLVLSGLVLFFMHLCRPVRVAPSWDKPSFILLLKTGMPIFILDYISTTTGTCDRLVLLKLGGVKLVGYYAVALMARDAIGIIPGALSEYIYPRMSHSFGQHHDPIRLWKMAVKSSLMVVAFMTPAAIAGWFLLPPVVSKLFPQYTEAVRAAQWLLISSVFGGATLGRMAIWSMKDWKLATWYQALGIVFGITGIILGGYFGKTPLIGVAVGSLAAQVAWLPVGGYLVYLATHRRAAPSAK